jgi:hypothetical protein
MATLQYSHRYWHIDTAACDFYMIGASSRFIRFQGMSCQGLFLNGSALGASGLSLLMSPVLCQSSCPHVRDLPNTDG